MFCPIIRGVVLTAVAPLALAAPDSYSIVQGEILVADGLGGRPGGVLANDGGVSSATLGAGPVIGALTFYPDGTFIYTPPPNFFGDAAFSYVSADGAGGTTLETEIVGSNATWKFSIPSSEPSTGAPSFYDQWTLAAYDDATWGTGSGLMAYGSITGSAGTSLPVDTVLPTPPPGSRRTGYFRHKFNVTDAKLVDLRVRLSRDDAAIIYFNGQELFRSHEAGAQAIRTASDRWDLMIEGDPSAWTNSTNEGTIYETVVPNVALLAGQNVMAISVHNNNNPTQATSGDLGLRVENAVARFSAETATIHVADGQLAPRLEGDVFVLTPGQLLDTSVAGGTSLYANDALLAPNGTAWDPILALEITPVPAAVGEFPAINPQTGHFRFQHNPNHRGLIHLSYRVRDKDGFSAPATLDFQVQDAITPLVFNHLEPRGASVYAIPIVNGGLGESAVPRWSFDAMPGMLSVRWVLAGEASARIVLKDANGAEIAQSATARAGTARFDLPASASYQLALERIDAGSTATDYRLDAALNALETLATAGATQATELVLQPGPPGQSALQVVSAIVDELSSRKFRVLVPPGAANLTVGWDGDDEMIERIAVRTVQDLVLADRAGSGSPLRYLVPLPPMATEVVCELTTSDSGPGVLTLAFGAALPVEADDTLGESTSLANQRQAAGYIGGGAGLPPVTAVAFGDYGSSASTSDSVAGMVTVLNPDFIIGLGDHNYGGTEVGSPSWEAFIGSRYGSYIKARADGAFATQTSPIQRFFAVVGNHDVNGSVGQTTDGDINGFLDYFHDNPGGVPRLPSLTGGANSVSLYYRFTQGPVEFFVLDSNRILIDPAMMATQRAWLEQVVPASNARWQVVCQHHQIYASGAFSSYQTLDALTWIPEVPGVDAVINAHAHFYERVVRNGKPIITAGTGGRSLYPTSPGFQPGSQFLDNTHHGVVSLSATDTWLKFEFVRIPEAGEPSTGVVLDSMMLGSMAPADVDVFELGTIASGSLVKVTLTHPPRLPGTPGFVSRREILGESGNVLASDDSGAAAPLVWTVAAPQPVQRLFVRIGSASGSGEYHLTTTIRADNAFGAWQEAEFGLVLPQPHADPSADPDGDSLDNVIEYSLAGDPLTADLDLLPSFSGQELNRFLQFFVPAPPPVGVAYSVEASEVLTSPWTQIATRATDGTWAGSASVETASVPGATQVRVHPPPSAAERWFVRLRATLSQ
ncbi:MAG: Ig-like domain-containing protein [Verrucomicrobiales bacterium]